jgi:hypothetical protein
MGRAVDIRCPPSTLFDPAVLVVAAGSALQSQHGS